MASAIAELWLLASECAWNHWFMAVASEANPADPLSRPGTAANDSFAADRGCRRVDPAVLEARGFRLHLPEDPISLEVSRSTFSSRRCR